MDKLLGQTLHKKNKYISTNQVTESNELIGLYFSGKYCPSCVTFTPLLIDIYNKIQIESPNKLEIVFISSDKCISDFNNYYNEMPWLALPWLLRDKKIKLCRLYGIKIIPKLIFLNSNGEIVNVNGRNLLQDNTINTYNDLINLLK